MIVQHLAIFGLGKLGLPLAALFARSGLRVAGIDVDRDLIRRLNQREWPDAEPGLAEILANAERAISYDTDADAAAGCDASIILVETPSAPSSPAFSTAQVEAACKSLCRALRARRTWRYHLFVIGSTLFPGTLTTAITPVLEKELGRIAGSDFGVAYVPDFAALGNVLHGYRHPAFLLVGSDDAGASERAAALYRRIVAPDVPTRIMSARDAELAKLACNVFLCLKVSFGNFLGQLGDGIGGADLNAITETLALDPRIGAGLLRSGTSFGGPCLARDIDAAIHLARSAGASAPLMQAVAEVNSAQYDLIERHAIAAPARRIALLGLSFKAGTPVTIGSPAFELARRFLARSLSVAAFDPAAKARSDARDFFGPALTCYETLDDCLRETDTVVVCNPEPCFAGIASKVARAHRIIDPWGCVTGTHPGLVRIGRKPSAQIDGSAPPNS